MAPGRCFRGSTGSARTRRSRPKWSDKPLLKSYQKTKPPLGWPRETDSLCPTCVREARQAILDGTKPLESLLNEKVGEIKATIRREGRQDRHGQGLPHPRALRRHDGDRYRRSSSTSRRCSPAATSARTTTRSCTTTAAAPIKHGRGSVLTVDLTNRCNMMCDPCFMDANQVGFVHELTWDDIKTVLDNAITIKPRRQMSVQFSGGEPTLSPYFLDAVRYARKVGYNSVQAATNGIEFAKSFDFAKAAAEAGLRYAYLQFDGIGNAANSHRRVGNLFDVKLRAIENLHTGRRRHRPGHHHRQRRQQRAGRPRDRVRARQPEEDQLPVVPAGVVHRPRRGSDARAARRAALHAVAPRARRQEPDRLGEPIRDWFPISFMGDVHRLGRHRARARTSSGATSPAAAIRTAASAWALMIDKETKEAVPVTAFLHAEQLAKDLAQVNDAARGRFLSIAGMALALMRNYDPFKAPTHFRIVDLMKKFDKTFGATKKARTGLRQGRRRPDDAAISRSGAPIAGTSCSSPGCGSRTCSTTTSAAPRCASSRMRRSRAKSRSAPTTPASAGGTSSRRCT